MSTEIDFGDGYVGRIIARHVWDGRIEFGFRVEGYQDIFPTARFFPRDPGHGRWLRSSLIAIPRTGNDDDSMSDASDSTSSTDIPVYSVDDYDNDGSSSNTRSNEGSNQVSRTTKRWELGVALYQYGADLRVHYNDFENCPTGWNCTESSNAVAGYRGGHSGWDSNRRSSGHTQHAFHSLTAGKVVCLDTNRYGLIGIKDNRGYITKYLHGDPDSGLVLGQSVRLYQRLGITNGRGADGDTDAFDPHVHVEVAKPGDFWDCLISNGASHASSVDPVDYLYDNWIGN